MLRVTPNLALPDHDLEIRFVRSRGPGGQNVNKVNTRAQLRFDLAGCTQLSPDVKQRLERLAGHLLTQQGHLIIESDRFREQGRNRHDCCERLVALVRQALVKPRPRRPTRPTRGSVERRLSGKRQRSQVKQRRRQVHPDD